MNWELPDVQVGFRKGRGIWEQIANICWIIEKAKEFQKSIYFCFTDCTKAFYCVDHNKSWKILEEMGVPDHLPCLPRNLYVDQEATEQDMEQLTGSKLGKECNKTVYHPAYLTSMQSSSWEMLAWMKHKLESSLLGEISIIHICWWYHPYGRKWRGTKKPLDEGERGEWNSWLKTQHPKN